MANPTLTPPSQPLNRALEEKITRLITTFYNLPVPPPDESVKTEWLAVLPAALRATYQRLAPANLMGYLPFLAYYVPQTHGTLEAYLQNTLTADEYFAFKRQLT